MSQIVEKGVKRALVVGALVAPNMSTVMADETSDIIRTSISGDGVTNTTSEADIVSDLNQDIVSVNSAIQKLASESNGLLLVKGSLTAQDNTVGTINESLKSIASLLNEYETLKAQVDAQEGSMKGIGGSVERVELNLSGSDYSSVITSLSRLTESMRQAVAKNTEMISKVSTGSQMNKELVAAVNDANGELNNQEGQLKSVSAAIVNNYKAVKEKADSSKHLVVDTSGLSVAGVTESANNVTVSSKADIDAKKQEALDAIAEANRNAQALNNSSKTYKETAISNIDKINSWLENVDSMSKVNIDSSDVEKALSDYKTEMKAKLTALKTELESRPDLSIDKGVTVDIDTSRVKRLSLWLYGINQALQMLDNLELSEDRTSITLPDVDFGDLGRVNVDEQLSSMSTLISQVPGLRDAYMQSKTNVQMKLSNSNSALVVDDAQNFIDKIIQEHDLWYKVNETTIKYNEDVYNFNHSTFDKVAPWYKQWSGDSGAYNTDWYDRVNDFNNWLDGDGSDRYLGISATVDTVFEMTDGGIESPGIKVFEELLANVDSKFVAGNTWAFPIGRSITITVKDTTDGDYRFTFGDVRSHGQRAREAYLSMWFENGKIVFGLGVGDGANFSFIDSYSLRVSNDRYRGQYLKPISFNHLDDNERVFVRNVPLDWVSIGETVERDGSVFVGTGDRGISHTGPTGYGSPAKGSVAWDHVSLDGLNVELTHSNASGVDKTSIIGGLFGDYRIKPTDRLSVMTGGALPGLPMPALSVASDLTLNTFEVIKPTSTGRVVNERLNPIPNYNLDVGNVEKPSGSVENINITGELSIPLIDKAKNPDPIAKKAASSNSLVVRQLDETYKRTASANSFVVRRLADK